MPRKKSEEKIVKEKRKAKPEKQMIAKEKKESVATAEVQKDFAPEEEKEVQDPFDVLRFVLMTEKSIQLIESQNKLVFIVDRRKDKTEIKRAIESAFQSKVQKVNTMIDQLGRKKAFVKFRESGQAGEIAIRLGII